MQKNVLIVSTGTSDLKLLVSRAGSNNVFAYRLGNRNLRQLHQKLLDGEVPYHIISSEKNLQELLGQNVNLIQDTGRASIGIKDKPESWEYPFDLASRNMGDSPMEAVLYEGKYLLLPAKLHTVLESLDKNEIDAIAVFYSDREKHVDSANPKINNSIDYENEPIATGKLIAHWLAQECCFPESKVSQDEGWDFAQNNACYINFMKHQYVLEGNQVLSSGAISTRDQPIALESARIFDEAIKCLAKSFPEHTAIVSHTGGFGDIKPVITASARFHFQGNIKEIHDNKYAKASINSYREQLFSTPAHIPRHEILDAKYHATQRIWEGDFAGAWAVVSHIENSDPQLELDGWVRHIKQAANFMEGWASHDETVIGQPIPKNELSEELNHLLWQAWQVEASLQFNKGEPWVNHALRHVTNLLEAALSYSLISYLDSTTVDGLKVTANNRIEKYVPTKCNESKVRTVKLDRHSIFNEITEHLPDAPLTKAISEFKNCLEYQFYKKENKSLFSFRNDVAHRSLSPEHIKLIIEYGNEKNLWCVQKNNQTISLLGSLFLDQGIIKPVFDAILPDDFTAAGELYRDFSRQLFQAIQSPL